MTLVKYPRTPHFPWSPGASKDDVFLVDPNTSFLGKEVVATEKMDGENTSMYRDHIHARSLDSLHHPSRTWVKSIHATIAHDIPEGWRVCGENMYAQHSVRYNNLKSYFLVFSIWNKENICLSWKETEDWAALLGLTTVPVLYRGTWDEQAIRNLYNPATDLETKEGYVVRVAESFDYSAFGKCVAKYVRHNHVTTSNHWLLEKITPNGIASP